MTDSRFAGAVGLSEGNAPRSDGLTVLPGGVTVDTEALKGRPVGDTDGLYRLRRLIEPELAAEACAHFDPEKLAWFESHITLFTDTTTAVERCYRLHRSFYSSLLRPAMTNTDLAVLTPMWREIDHHLRRGLATLHAHPAEIPNSGSAYHQLIDAYRTRHPDLVRRAVQNHLQRNELGFRAILVAAS
jgi:DNA-binding GntR family transcriptional regulator